LRSMKQWRALPYFLEKEPEGQTWRRRQDQQGVCVCRGHIPILPASSSSFAWESEPWLQNLRLTVLSKEKGNSGLIPTNPRSVLELGSQCFIKSSKEKYQKMANWWN
jgi:hypothetical protein